MTWELAKQYLGGLEALLVSAFIAYLMAALPGIVNRLVNKLADWLEATAAKTDNETVEQMAENFMVWAERRVQDAEDKLTGPAAMDWVKEQLANRGIPADRVLLQAIYERLRADDASPVGGDPYVNGTFMIAPEEVKP